MEEKRDFQGCPEKRETKQYQKPTFKKYTRIKNKIAGTTPPDG